MAKRIVSGFIIALVALVAAAVGGELLLVTLFLSSCVAFYELANAVDGKLGKGKLNAVRVVGTVAIVLFYLCMYLDMKEVYLMAVTVMVLWSLLLVYVFAFPKYNIGQISKMFFCFFYSTVMLSFVYYVRGLEAGVFLVALIMAASWGSDTSAFIVGKLLGKHKLVPKLSPKKTVEGAIGGVVGAAIIAGIWAYFFLQDSYNIFFIIGVTAVCAILSQMGDLVASAIKRDNNLKDYGNIIPGHGGIMDRFDSMIYIAPILYFLLVIYPK